MKTCSCFISVGISIWLALIQTEMFSMIKEIGVTRFIIINRNTTASLQGDNCSINMITNPFDIGYWHFMQCWKIEKRCQSFKCHISFNRANISALVSLFQIWTCHFHVNNMSRHAHFDLNRIITRKKLIVIYLYARPCWIFSKTLTPQLSCNSFP